MYALSDEMRGLLTFKYFPKNANYYIDRMHMYANVCMHVKNMTKFSAQAKGSTWTFVVQLTNYKV